MKILAFSDFRVQSFELLEKSLRKENPDVVLYAGDDLERFAFLAREFLWSSYYALVKITCPHCRIMSNLAGVEFTPEAIRLLAEVVKEQMSQYWIDKRRASRRLISTPFYCVRGNDDRLARLGCDEYFNLWGWEDYGTDERGLHHFLELKGRIIRVSTTKKWQGLEKKLNILPRAPTRYGLFEIKTGRERATIWGVGCTFGVESKGRNVPNQHADIYLSHLPPLGVLDLSKRFGVNHVGSARLRTAVLQYKPRFVLCGHSHMWGGRAATLGETTVINISNGDDDRDVPTFHYASIETKDWSYELRTERDISRTRVMGMGPLMRREEVFGFIDPQATNEEILKEARRSGVEARMCRQRVLSFRWKSPKIVKSLRLPPMGQSAFLDVETGLAIGRVPGRLVLIGLLYGGQIVQFDWPRDRSKFVKFLKEKGLRHLVHWSEYDRNALRSRIQKWQLGIDFVDLMRRVGTCVIWHKYSLNEFHAAMRGGPAEKVKTSGKAVGIYVDHVVLGRKRCRFCPPKSQILSEARSKNRRDLVQMAEICQTLLGSNALTMPKQRHL